MSGHNKWSKIKHKKAATDAKRSKIFSKHSKLITVESKLVGGDVNSPALKAAIDQAKAVNMPADNIARAVKKGASADAISMEAITYEAYGPGGCAFIIEALTDSKNRAAAEVRHILSKNGSYELAGIGAVTWAFTKEGNKWTAQNTVPLSDEDMEKAAKLIDLLEDGDDVQEVFTNIED
ncbi:MAG: YebC/PmpR family DNA-binding transcriptional regulator [Candidatus Pacebacteria bacterium]|nr:YebC/PmpR family DNA-binding transcriptional regulator [Candidatus Paceibacterota bacterium]